MNIFPTEVLFNFISPVTGRVLSDTNYVLYGDRRGIAMPSPIIIDIRLDLINLRVDFDVASSASYIIGFSNSRLPNAQVLNSLSNGFLFNTSGTVSTFSIIPIGFLPNLATGNIWIGDNMNRPAPNPTISIDNLPNLATGNIWIGNDMNRPTPNPTITIDNLPNLATGNIWIGDNMNRPAPLPNIQLNNMAPLGRGNIWQGDINGRPVETNITSIISPFVDNNNQPNNIANSAVDSGVSSLVKYGLEKLLNTSASLLIPLLGGAIGSASGIVFNIAQSYLGSLNKLGDGGIGNYDSIETIIDNRFKANSRNNSLILQPGAGAPTASEKTMIYYFIDMNLGGGRITDIAPSPQADYDAVNAKWVWDLLNDNVEIIWS